MRKTNHNPCFLLLLCAALVLCFLLGCVRGASQMPSAEALPSNSDVPPGESESGYFDYVELQIPLVGIEGWEQSRTDCSFTRDDALVLVEGMSCKAMGIDKVTGIKTDEDALRAITSCSAVSEAADFELESVDNIRLGGKSAQRIEAIYVAEDGTPMRIVSIALHYGANYSFISLIAPTALADAYLSDFEAFLAAIKTG